MKKLLDFLTFARPGKAANQPATGTTDQTGKVFLVGAGPGSVDMLTLRAARLISEADVVLIDALVDPECLALARDDARIVDVGKRCGKRSASQVFINRQLLHHAKAGRMVVRLKAGDPFVFGRGGEERDFLVDHDVDVTVIPGVSAAMAAACDAGDSLTWRGTHRQTVLMTGSTNSAFGKEEEKADWQHLCARGSVCLYMPRHQLDEQLADMRENGMADDTPITIVANAGSENAVVRQCFFHNLKDSILSMPEEAPVVMLVNARQGLQASDAISPDTWSRTASGTA